MTSTHPASNTDDLSNVCNREQLDANGFTDGRPERPPPNLAQVRTAMAFLTAVGSIKTPSRSSYGLKHHAEDWGKANGLERYVSNGALLAAAFILGFPVRRRYDDGPNALVAVSKKGLRKEMGKIADSATQ